MFFTDGSVVKTSMQSHSLALMSTGSTLTPLRTASLYQL